MLHRFSLRSLLVCAAGPGSWEAERPLWLAVTTSSLEGALEPLADRRCAEGLEVLVSTKTVGEALAASPRAPSYLLLVGDQPARFTTQMTKGGLLNVLMGYATADFFHSMRYGSRSVDYTVDDAREILSQGSPAARSRAAWSEPPPAGAGRSRRPRARLSCR